MKVKKLLFKISGILKCIVGSIVILLFGLLLALSGSLKQVLIQSGNMIETMVKDLINIDPSYAYLLEWDIAQIADFLMGIVNVFAIFMLVMGIITIVLAVFNFIFVKKYDTWMQGRLGRKIVFTILSFVLCWELITNILTTVALFLKDERINTEDTIIIE